MVTDDAGVRGVPGRYDVIVALDEGIRRDLLRAAEAENTGDVRWYSDRLCSISTFSHYLGDEILAGWAPCDFAPTE